MKCNNCGKDVYGTPTKCPYCFSDLAYYNNTKGIINKHGTFFNSGGLSFLFFVFPLVCIFVTVVLIGLNILGKVLIANIILKMIFSLAIITLVINGVTTLKNNIETDQADPHNKLYKPKKKGIALGWTLVSIILLVYPSIFKLVLKHTVNLEGIDYSNPEYITIGDAQIPSLYSVIGEKEIIINLGVRDEYDETYGFKYDGLTIIYSELTEIDINLYELRLLENGYQKITLSNEDDEMIEAYVKNNSNNTFIIVCAIDTEITYGVAEGNYEDYLIK